MTSGFVDRSKGKLVFANTYTSQNGLFYASAQDGITAFPAATQSTATPLSNMISRVTTAASAAAGVRLMPAVAGLEITLINAVNANGIKVFASGTDTVDGIAGSTGTTLAAGGTTGKVANYYCATNGIWHSQVGA